ncbi:MAG: VIT domain-containing protein [Armatimonas sp.]
MKHKLWLTIAALGTVLSPTLAKQETQLPLPPRIRIQAKIEQPVSLQKVEIGLNLTGPLASATETLTFFNPNNRVLEGELLMPLPEGATLSGYAIDVKGELVDAVPVEKEQARVVYETEVRKGVDPGLAEKAEGNQFRLRVYPIPAGGTRTIRVRFDLDTQESNATRMVTLPLWWGAAPDQTTIAVEGGSARLGDISVDGVLRLSKQPLNADLVVRAPIPAGPHAYMETFTPAGTQAPETFFLIENHEIAAQFDHAPSLSRFTILWDASLSRKDADLALELELLRLLLARLNGVTIGVRVLRDTLEAERTFPIFNGDGSALLNYLRSVPLDGGTDLNVLKNLPRATGGGFYLLFSDGISTLGRTNVGLAGSPLWAVSSGPQANYPYLRSMAERSGGSLVNLTQNTLSASVWEVGQPAFGLQKVEMRNRNLAAKDIHFRREGNVIVGKLVSGNAHFDLQYGYTGNPALIHREVSVGSPVDTPANRMAAGTLARWWAAQEAEELSIDEETNREALVKLGQDYGIVTEGTSLLVLETLEQHVEHHIPPARSRAALYDAYLAEEQKRVATQKKKSTEQLNKLAQRWKELVAWWDTRFTYPDNFRYKEKQAMKDGDERTTTRFRRAPADAPARALRVASPSTGRPSAGEGLGGFRGGLAATRVAKRFADEESAETMASVTIKAWSPNVPYVKAMKAAGVELAYATYLKERETWGATPGFYIDCAETLFQLGLRAEGRRVLLSLAEIGAGDPALLRILGRRLVELKESDLAVAIFDRVRLLRPEEPHSLRDLALAYEANGNYQQALNRLDELVRGRWQREDSDFEDINLIALVEANGILSRLGPGKINNPLDTRLVRPLTADLRIVMGWDTDLTDMDLHVVEPSSEECFYGHNRTAIGGHLSDDCTRGYGPEEYVIRKAMPGSYKVLSNFYGSASQKALGPTTVQATVITNFGRPNEKRSFLTLRLRESKETVDIGTVRIGS